MVTANNFHDLELVQIFPTSQGIYVSAKHPGWSSSFDFFINPKGSILGKTNSGNWLELSHELGAFIQAKVHSYLIDKNPA